MGHFTYLDYFFLGVMAISTLFGFFRGFLKSFISLLLWFIALGLSFYLGQHYFYFFARFSQDHNVQLILAYISFFIIVAIVEWFLKHLLDAFLDDREVSATDRFFGALFGFFRGLLFIMIMAYGMVLMHSSAHFMLPDSILLPSLMSATNWVSLMAHHVATMRLSAS